MSDCKYQQLLNAYHDGELEGQAHDDVHQHIQSCESCRDELSRYRQLTSLIRAADSTRQSDVIRPDELRRIHTAVRHMRHDQPLLRIAGYMSAIAASVLIISAAWLTELPVHPLAIQSPVSLGGAAWEQVALREYVPSVPFQNDDTRNNLPALARADEGNTQFVNWMLLGLSK